jgi:hypothetical protein
MTRGRDTRIAGTCTTELTALRVAARETRLLERSQHERVDPAHRAERWLRGCPCRRYRGEDEPMRRRRPMRRLMHTPPQVVVRVCTGGLKGGRGTPLPVRTPQRNVYYTGYSHTGVGSNV